MKVLFCFLLVVAGGCCQAQGVSFSTIDWQVSSIDASSPDSLAYKLTARYTTQREKVRAIFRWITDNISYKTRGGLGYTRSFAERNTSDDEQDTALELKPLNLRVAESVLQKRVAVCEGYSRLFKTLCDYAGIRCEIITGYARGDVSRAGKNFRANHSWNGVYFDSSWHLLDVTWASGFISYRSNEYVKQYDDFYFLTPPHLFIRDHYPEDPQWTLLSDLPTLKEFEHTPFKLSAFIKHKIVSFTPKKGIIEAALGDTLQFELETEDPHKELHIASSPFIDTVLQDMVQAQLIPSWAKKTVSGRKVRVSFPVDNDSLNWLYVIYNNEVIMRYKLNVKKDKVALK